MIAAMVIVSFLIVVGLLAYVLVGPFEKSEPTFVKLERPIKMIGISTRTGMKSVYRDVAELGKRYRSLKKSNIVQNKQDPWAFVAISKDFNDDGSWEYLMGDVVTTFDPIPPSLESFEIPMMAFAVFPIRPKSRFAWGIEIGRTKKYIYTEWLPTSNYEADTEILGDFEFHDGRSLGKNPEINLYVAIREKKK